MVIVVACGGGGAGASIEGQAVTVQMFDNRYEYTEITVPVGGTVTFVGAGHNPHNAMASDGSWSTEAVFGSLEQHDGDAATIDFDTPGTYTFYCTFHGSPDGEGMAGTIIVEAP
jgi:plastocyanin